MNRSQQWSAMGIVLIASLVAALIPASTVVAQEAPPAWKVGAASVKITPDTLMWMAGYAKRTKPAEGVDLDLFAKALVIEDNGGKRLTLITFDLVGVSRTLREAIAGDLARAYQIAPETLCLNASHTHCGPQFRVTSGTANLTPQTERERQGQEYVEQLRKKVVEVVGQAIAKLAPAKLDYMHSWAGFAFNRRRPPPDDYAFEANSEGVVDHNVPVLRVTSADGGTLIALLFGYACHNTTLDYYKFNGDYAGYAQKYLEEDYPGTVALFMMGCGGDQNPYPRREPGRAEQHGRTLATAVEGALGTVPRPISGPLDIVWGEAQLEFTGLPDRAKLLELASSDDSNEKQRATRLLERLEREGQLPTTYSYPIQVFHFGKDLTMVALSSEVVVDYSLRLKRELPGVNWIAGYCNDMFAYIPSRRVLEEGGYEAIGGALYPGFTAPFAPSVEERIIGKVLEMVGQ